MNNKDLKIKNSFAKVRNDMNSLWAAMETYRDQIKYLYDKISYLEKMKSFENTDELNDINQRLRQIESKVISLENGKEQKIVLNKLNGMLHTDGCKFAKSIKNENKKLIKDASQLDGVEYVRCSCMQ